MSGNDGVGGASGYGSGFTLIVVLFILLIIVGAAFVDGYGGNGGKCY
ncbi:YjcZ family sporulation protein [Psychrobacillus sp. INOP01]|nr:YjcZ family sporulation protein [Psychrobacillus sp. INOP01]QUG40294.1 YjcZ family sporulation protein [Psychrobacillus sp. INOP01]